MAAPEVRNQETAGRVIIDSAVTTVGAHGETGRRQYELGVKVLGSLPGAEGTMQADAVRELGAVLVGASDNIRMAALQLKAVLPGASEGMVLSLLSDHMGAQAGALKREMDEMAGHVSGALDELAAHQG
jgi:hypothetical protein